MIDGLVDIVLEGNEECAARETLLRIARKLRWRRQGESRRCVLMEGREDDRLPSLSYNLARLMDDA